MHMTCLNFDLTRRCNLACDFCFRGKPQNIDISREIIDKTFDEIGNDTLIDELRIFGGEPFLVPELIEYLFDQIIQRKIKIAVANTFTNATIKSKRVAEAFNRLGNYLGKSSNPIHFDFKDRTDVKVLITFSTEGHKNKKCIDDVISFYENLTNQYVFLQRQDEEVKGLMIIEGSADANFNELISDVSPVKLGHFRRRIDEYWFVADDIITKTISISANGNVYLGASASYESTDQKPMFSILDCKRDFFNKLLEFCWKYPVNDKINDVREKYQTALYFRRKHVDTDLSESSFNTIRMLNDLSLRQEKHAKDLHMRFPALNLAEVELISSVMTLINIHEGNFPEEAFTTYLLNCTHLKELDFPEFFSIDTGLLYIAGAFKGAETRLGANKEI